MSETQLADQYLYQSSLKSDPDVRVSSRKHVPHVIDLNQGSYSNGIITFDATSQLNGSEGFSSLRDAYIMLPYKVTMKNGGVNQATAANRFSVGLKCGVWNVIDSLSLELNGKSLLSMSDYKLFWNNFRAQTEFSSQYVDIHGADSFLYPDSSEAVQYSAAADVNGDGYSANRAWSAATTFSAGLGPSSLDTPNDGHRKRLLANPPTVNVASFPAHGDAASSVIIANQMARGGFTAGVATADLIMGTWDYMLKIRLVDLHPIFKEIDLMANPQIRLRLRVNQGSTAIASQYTSPTANKLMTVTSTTLRSGNTCPIMISSTAAGNPNASVLSSAVSTTFSVHWGAVTNSADLNVGSVFPFTTSRLYVPFYYLENPQAIISKPVKKVRYNDCYAQYFIQRTGNGKQTTPYNTSFDLQLSASIKNAKYVVLMPFAETSMGNFATAAVQQFQSPFDSAPWTLAPGSSIRNWNVRIGSDQCFTLSHDYDFRTFADELSKIGAINGDLTPELCNGLIDYKTWSATNRVLVADVSRLTQKDVPQSIQIMGSNAGCQGLNILVLVISEQEMSYDRLTGEVLEYTTN